MLNTGLNGSTCPDRGDYQLIQSQVSQAAASFLSSGGQEIPVVAGVGAVVDSLRGPDPTEVSADPIVGLDPARLPFATSVVEVLPPLPANADYADALLEEF